MVITAVVLLVVLATWTVLGARFAKERWAETAEEAPGDRIIKTAASGAVGGFAYLMGAAWILAIAAAVLLFAGAIFWLLFSAVL